MSGPTAREFFEAGAFGGPMAEAAYIIAAQASRAADESRGEPFVIYGATLAPDGTKWCALLGENIMEGVTGYGDTPASAVADFNNNWHTQRTPYATQLAAKEADR